MKNRITETLKEKQETVKRQIFNPPSSSGFESLPAGNPVRDSYTQSKQQASYSSKQRRGRSRSHCQAGYRRQSYTPSSLPKNCQQPVGLARALSPNPATIMETNPSNNTVRNRAKYRNYRGK